METLTSGASPALGLDLSHLVALAAALGWASGMRLYAVVFITGAAGFLGWVPLPPGLQLLQNPVVLGASFLLFVVEFFADKIPGVDSLWDAAASATRCDRSSCKPAFRAVFTVSMAGLACSGKPARRLCLRHWRGCRRCGARCRRAARP
jgi:hypothetical protein